MNLYLFFFFTLIFLFLFFYRLHLIQQECLKQIFVELENLKQISINLDNLKAEQYLILTKLTETNHKTDTFVDTSEAFYGIIFLICIGLTVGFVYYMSCNTELTHNTFDILEQNTKLISTNSNVICSIDQNLLDLSLKISELESKINLLIVQQGSLGTFETTTSASLEDLLNNFNT